MNEFIWQYTYIAVFWFGVVDCDPCIRQLGSAICVFHKHSIIQMGKRFRVLAIGTHWYNENCFIYSAVLYGFVHVEWGVDGASY